MISELSKELKLVIRQVDVEKEHELASEYKITSIPALLLIKDGTVIDKVVGSKPKELVKNKLISFSQE